jgi:ankyrin repeat protein
MSGSHSTDDLLDELFDLSQSSASLSEDSLREIIQRYGCEPNNNHRVENFDFFLEFCSNNLVTEGILRCLLEYFPDAANVSSDGWLPVHMICLFKNATRAMVQLLIDADPESIDRANNDDVTPLHFLCANTDVEDNNALDILALFLERSPAAAQRVDGYGCLPIHKAAGQGSKSLEFCRMLIEAYPGSERVAAPEKGLPLHGACRRNTVAVAEYLYNLYPESINVAAGSGLYPILYAIEGLAVRTNPDLAIEMVLFLLDRNPDAVLQKYAGNLPLYWVCRLFDVFDAWLDEGLNSKVNAALQIAKVLYDARPEAIIEDDDISRDLRAFPEEIRTFINTQLNLARLARNSTARQMKKRDENGQLPLHQALHDNVTLGSIKLLVKRNPSVILTPDNSGALPLHVACQHTDSTKIVDYLVGLDSNTLTAVDREGNTALHHACHGAKYDTIALLLEKYGAVSVSQSNVCNKLPIHLLFESKAVVNTAGDTKYLESVFQLLRAYPETVMVSKDDEKQQGTRHGKRPSRSGRKRKYYA